jgi:aspartyl/asparaginyl beta-hydroxylase (cupin superfamily)
MGQQLEPWYMIDGGRYPGQDPYFYNADEYPWVKTLEDNWQVIHQELTDMVESQGDRLKPYFHKLMAFPPNAWKTSGFYFWGYRLHGNCNRCPNLTRVLDSIPGLTAGSLSVLEAGANINPHQGDTNAIIRAHLGLSVPASLPECGFQVGPEIRPWQEGKMLLFCDAHTHTAWNHSTKRRAILIVDVMRPEYLSQTNAICSHVFASAVVQRLTQGPWLSRLPGRSQKVLHFFFRSIIRVLLPIERRLGVFVPAPRPRVDALPQPAAP